MHIYHGSENVIEKPIYGYGKKYNDYGLGFYCTEDIELAKEWAVDYRRNGYANEYSLNLSGLNVLNLNDGKYSILHWLSLLLLNRDFYLNTPISIEAKKYLLENYLPDCSNADIIRGYRADDSYFSFARDFLSNSFSLEQLSEAMHFGNLGEQIVLKSRESFEKIEYIANVEVDSNIWYPKKESRDSLARKKYHNLDKRAFRRGETYILKILEEEL